MMHPITTQAYGRARQQDMLRAAEQHRRARQALAGRPALAARLLAGLRGQLTAASQRSQERPTPQNSGALGWIED